MKTNVEVIIDSKGSRRYRLTLNFHGRASLVPAAEPVTQSIQFSIPDDDNRLALISLLNDAVDDIKSIALVSRASG